MMGLVMTVRATRKLLDRLGPATTDPEQPTTVLGDWYATALPWRPRQLALMMSDRTLLPVLLPLAPASNSASPAPAAASPNTAPPSHPTGPTTSEHADA